MKLYRKPLVSFCLGAISAFAISYFAFNYIAEAAYFELTQTNQKMNMAILESIQKKETEKTKVVIESLMCSYYLLPNEMHSDKILERTKNYLDTYYKDKNKCHITSR